MGALLSADGSTGRRCTGQEPLEESTPLPPREGHVTGEETERVLPIDGRDEIREDMMQRQLFNCNE
jgi:hypothetical protein